MNAQVLNNQFSKFWCNKQKAIAWTKARVAHDWDQLQNDALQIKPTSKSTLVKLASFWTVCSFGHSHMGCGVHAPQCGDQVKKEMILLI
jgi:hypothetical protein